VNQAQGRAYYAAAAPDFQRAAPAAILGELVAHHSFAVDEKQRGAWQAEIVDLQGVAAVFPDSFIFLELAIPRMGKRVDAVVVCRGLILVIEYKVGAREYQRHAIDQVLDYALDLKNFHEGSHNRTVVPILVATAAPDLTIECKPWSDGLVQPICANRKTLHACISQVTTAFHSPHIDALAWAASPYKPTPTIVEAAQALYQGHDVAEISRSEAGAKNLTRTAAYISRVIDDARSTSTKAICFVTGVPGSGKTLAGLNIASQRMKTNEGEHAVFLSGNGPLVSVLREALARDEVEKNREAGKKSVNKKDAYRKASTFIQNIHHFRDENLKTSAAPAERVAVFDEAQRAWNKKHTSRFMSEKRGQAGFDMSEPEFLLNVMDRHSDWCVVVCLIGGGQEINTGEAGLEGWLLAVNQLKSQWHVHISDRLSSADYLAEGTGTFSVDRQRSSRSADLHLAVSVRSFRAEALSEFVGKVIDGDAAGARTAHGHLSNYPLVLTRDLEVARHWIRRRGRGTERTGLVASSNALRLRPFGLHVKAQIDPCDWFLGPPEDVRSSYALEDVATEFDIQGLELDWTGVCWDANFRRENGAWKGFRFRGTRWERISDPTRVSYLENSYRVILTRARQGMVIIVPHGSDLDETREPAFYDETYEYLVACGVVTL
jgi:hypothetical protein